MLTMTVEETKRELRARRLVVTYFGESDLRREARLRSVLVKEGEMTKGQTNLFNKLNKIEGDELVVFKDEIVYDDAYLSEEGVSDEQVVERYFGYLLHLWEKELQMRSEAEKKSTAGKSAAMVYKQCELYMQPLFDKLQSKTMNNDVLTKLREIVRLCKRKEFLRAESVYMQLSIGNALWPMGVTAVSIHQRSGQTKIREEASGGHVLNDETTRKYIQSVKRLVSFAQQRKEENS